MFIHDGGVENVAEGIVKQARKDFIKMGKKLYSRYGRIPSKEEYYSGTLKYTSEAVKNFYDAWQFVIQDPYSIFGDVGNEIVINEWKTSSIVEYYREIYINSAIVIYSKAPELMGPRRHGDYKLNEKDDEEIYKIVGNKVGDEYIRSRNYIYSIGQNWKFKEWNRIAAERVRRS